MKIIQFIKELADKLERLAKDTLKRYRMPTRTDRLSEAVGQIPGSPETTGLISLTHNLATKGTILQKEDGSPIEGPADKALVSLFKDGALELERRIEAYTGCAIETRVSITPIQLIGHNKLDTTTLFVDTPLLVNIGKGDLSPLPFSLLLNLAIKLLATPFKVVDGGIEFTSTKEVVWADDPEPNYGCLLFGGLIATLSALGGAKSLGLKTLKENDYFGYGEYVQNESLLTLIPSKDIKLVAEILAYLLPADVKEERISKGSQAPEKPKTKSVFDSVLAQGGVAVSSKLPSPEVEESLVKDKRFVFTGEDFLESKWRLEAAIKKAGGKVVTSVSKTTSYLVCNSPEDAAARKSKKLEDAKKLGIPIISEVELLALFTPEERI